MNGFPELLRRTTREFSSWAVRFGMAGTSTLEWTALRAPRADVDLVLDSETHYWLRRIPGSYHPKQTCRHYPRVVNRLAQSWHDRTLADRVLLDLLVDQRGGRKGFPPRVFDELQGLRQLREMRSFVPGRVFVVR